MMRATMPNEDNAKETKIAIYENVNDHRGNDDMMVMVMTKGMQMKAMKLTMDERR